MKPEEKQILDTAAEKDEKKPEDVAMTKSMDDKEEHTLQQMQQIAESARSSGGWKSADADDKKDKKDLSGGWAAEN